MATEKKITSRIQQKHDVAANWAKATNFIPKKGEIIIYDAEYSASGEETQAVRFKIGDGSKTVNNLPFAAIDYKSIKSINTNNTAAQAVNTSEAIAGSGTINLHKVAKTGSYNDLLHKPTIPAVNNGALTLTVNGTAHTFTANQSGDTSVTINDTGVTSVSLSGDGNAVTNASIDGRAMTLTRGTTFLTSQSIKSINTNNTAAQEPKTDESIAGSGTINLHKIAKTGNYNDLLHKPTLGTAAEKNIGTSSGNVPILDSNGKLADSVIPAVAITDTYVIDTEEEMLALSAQKGDIAIRSDLNKSYVLQTTPASTLANWKELLTPTDTVLSVNGQTGTVELTASDVKALPSSTKYAASSEVGGAATSANKVNSNLIVKLNSGATEGTNLFTFNGSAAKTINITPSAIGAAASSHGTHVTADTVKAALGTGSGTSKYLREDGTWQTPSDTHYTNYLQIKGNNTEAVKFTQNADKTLNFKPGTNVSISAASGEITISSTDTNTATAADNILDGSNSGTEITYKPYTSQQSKLSFDTSTTNPTRTDRLNLNGHLHATKLYSGGKEVLTSHQDISGKLDKTTYEWNKEFRAGSNGAISLGRYNIYDTQLTFDISSTTSASMNGKLVIAAQNGVIKQAKVFGDATGALVSKIVIYQSAIVNNRSWVEVFCNFDGWSKNKVHIYGVALDSATVTNQMSSVTFTNGVPSPITSGDSKWNGTIDNDLSKKQDKLTAGSNISISGNTISATVPTVNNGKLTIQKNGTDVATFTANQSTNTTANITVPTNVSELTNDSGYTTNKGTVTSVSVKMNGATKGTVTSSGTIDLGTVLTSHQDISGKANLNGGNTFKGKQTFTDPPTNNAYSIDASGCVRGSWFQSSTIMHNDSNTGKVCVFDGSGWIFYRTPAEILTEAGGAKTADLPIKSATLTGTTLYLTL